MKKKVKKFLSSLRNKLPRLSQRNVLRGLAIVALAYLAAGQGPGAVASAGRALTPQTYILSLPTGEQILIQRPKHRADGAICFEVVGGEAPNGCIKYPVYFLQEQSVE